MTRGGKRHSPLGAVPPRLSRRHVLGGVAAAAVGLPGAKGGARAAKPDRNDRGQVKPGPAVTSGSTPHPVFPVAAADQPAWLWYPSERVLPNTFVLFRKTLALPAGPASAPFWITADSRYLLCVNGQRVLFGPAPCDPRQLDVDPIDLAPYLRPGENVIAATVLFYGAHDGTWVGGKPGFLMWGQVDGPDGRSVRVTTDETWQCHLSKAWPAGQHRRSYLRALQEHFDARLHPVGWEQPGYVADGSWRAPLRHDLPAWRPPIASAFRDDTYDVGGTQVAATVQPRTIALLRETLVHARAVESHRLKWTVPIEEYFDVKTRDACSVATGTPISVSADRVRFALDGRTSVAATYALPEQMVGFPGFEISAPEGTTVELMVQEGHVPGKVPIMNTHRHSWSRFICRAGVNRFRAFDYESCRWLQVHVHGPAGRVEIGGVSLLRRQYPFARAPAVMTDDAALNKLVSASINTLVNNAQETIVDGMGRERQQYSGDIGHCVHALHLLAGEAKLAARFLSTYSDGMTVDGYFLDCWPAPDRLIRMGQRQLGLTPWGPLLDHGIGFMFDCYNHHLYTGQVDDVRKPIERLLRFVQFLDGLTGSDGLLPVEDLGVPTVWIDHDAFAQQRHKQCAFNLYAAAAYMHALAPLLRATGQPQEARQVEAQGRRLLASTVSRFWDKRRGLFVSNLPWVKEDGGLRLDDRSLSQSVLFRQCPQGRLQPAVDALIEWPKEMGLSYPPNVVWNVWALGSVGRADAVFSDLHKRWVGLQSVKENNTLSEDWRVTPDTRNQWSHAPMAALLAFPMIFAGIRPTAPGWRTMEIAPRLAGLGQLDLQVHTPAGPIVFKSRGRAGGRTLHMGVPAAVDAVLQVAKEEALPLPAVGPGRYRLPAGESVEVSLAHG